MPEVQEPVLGQGKKEAHTITSEELNERLHYDGESLFWKDSRGGVRKGAAAGCVKGDGYLHTGVNGRKYLNHRLIFLMVHGFLPEFIDHADGNILNNATDNLRAATLSQNQWNRTHKSKSGYRGVSWNKAAQKWVAHVTINSKQVYLGVFGCRHEATSVATAYRQKHFGEFYRG